MGQDLGGQGQVSARYIRTSTPGFGRVFLWARHRRDPDCRDWPREPPLTLFGRKLRATTRTDGPNNDQGRHVRSRPHSQTLHRTRDGCLALFSPRKGACAPLPSPLTGNLSATVAMSGPECRARGFRSPNEHAESTSKLTPVKVRFTPLPHGFTVVSSRYRHRIRTTVREDEECDTSV